MWNRKELKARGKAAFKANYWRSVGAAVLLLMATGAGSASVGARTSSQNLSSQLSQMDQEQAVTIALVILGVVGLLLLLSTVLNIFIFRPLEVGARRFFLVNSEQSAEMNELTWGFHNGYLHTVGTMLLRDVFLALWCCLFLIPGIIKAYAYRMVPYILAEHPELSAKEVITLSRKMMYGHKMNAFVLDLSFLGWSILSVISLGLVGVFYANPYVAATDAELYKALRSNF